MPNPNFKYKVTFEVTPTQAGHLYEFILTGNDFITMKEQVLTEFYKLYDAGLVFNSESIKVYVKSLEILN